MHVIPFAGASAAYVVRHSTMKPHTDRSVQGPWQSIPNHQSPVGRTRAGNTLLRDHREATDRLTLRSQRHQSPVRLQDHHPNTISASEPGSANRLSKIGLGDTNGPHVVPAHWPSARRSTDWRPRIRAALGVRVRRVRTARITAKGPLRLPRCRSSAPPAGQFGDERADRGNEGEVCRRGHRQPFRAKDPHHHQPSG